MHNNSVILSHPLGALRSASGTTTNKESLKKAKTPQGRFDRPDEKSKDALQSEDMFFYVCGSIHRLILTIKVMMSLWNWTVVDFETF